MKIIKQEEQLLARDMIVNLINKKIKATPSEEKQIIIEIAELFINCNTVDCGEDFMDKLCQEFEENGWYMKYCPFLSFIWRHRIVLSKEPITNYRPTKSENFPRSKYQCAWFENKEAHKNFKKEVNSFMNAHTPIPKKSILKKLFGK